MASDSKPKSRKAREDRIQIDAPCCGAGRDEEDMSAPHALTGDALGESRPNSAHLRLLSEEIKLGVLPGQP